MEAVLADATSAKVIFVESQLNSDDFNYCQWKGEACFSFLGQQSSKFYSPSIESPVGFLRSRVWSGTVKSVNADEEFSVQAGETVFVHFRNGAAHPTQNDRLASHDAEIARIVARLGEKGVVYVYTGIEDHETHSRVARQATPEPATEAWESRGDFYVIRLLQVAHAVEGTRTNLTLTGLVPTFSNDSATTAKLVIPTTPNQITLDMVNDGGRWWVDTITYDNMHFTSGTEIGANDGFSFACTPEVTYVSPNSTATTLTFTGLQLELNMNRAPGQTYKMAFSEDWNCVGFTSPGIWGGLFVTILLLAIMTLGVSWMLDIKTMDRFDDPKGKTITINAQE